MRQEPIVHIEIPVRNIDRSKGFYEAVFKWTFGPLEKDETGEFVSFFLNEVPGGVLRHRPNARFGDGIWIYCQVDDVDDALNVASKHGGEIAAAKMRFSGGEYARIVDLDGTHIGLCLRPREASLKNQKKERE